MDWVKFLVVFSCLVYATSATYYYYPRPSYRPYNGLDKNHPQGNKETKKPATEGNKGTVKPVTEVIKEDDDSSEAHNPAVEKDKESDISSEYESSYYYKPSYPPYFIPYEDEEKEEASVSTVAQPVLPAHIPVPQKGQNTHSVHGHFGHQHPGGNVLLAGSIATNFGPHSSVHKPVSYKPGVHHGPDHHGPVHHGPTHHVPYGGHVHHHPPGTFAASGAIATNFGHPSYHYVPGSFASLGPVYHAPNYHVPSYHAPSYHPYYGGYRPHVGGYRPVYYGHRQDERADLEPVLVINGIPHLHASGSFHFNDGAANAEGGLMTSPGHPITLSIVKPQENVPEHHPEKPVVHHTEKPVVYHTEKPTTVHHAKPPVHYTDKPYQTGYYPYMDPQNQYFYYPNAYAYHPVKEDEDAAPAASEQVAAAVTAAPPSVAAASGNKKQEASKNKPSNQSGKEIPIDAVEVTAISASGELRPVTADAGKDEEEDARSAGIQELAVSAASTSGENASTAAASAAEEEEEASAREFPTVLDLPEETIATFEPADKDDVLTKTVVSSQESVDNEKTVANLNTENEENSVNEEPVTKSNE